MTRRLAAGAVTLEFLLLFPFVVAMLYASATYGITFFAKYKMQDAVDRAVAAGLYVDRSRHQGESEPSEEGSPLGEAVAERAESILDGLVGKLPAWPGERSGNCDLEDIEGGVTVVLCSLTYPDYQANPIVPTMSFGMLGTFPPLPGELKAEARAAF